MNPHSFHPIAPVHQNRFINHELIKGSQGMKVQSRPNSHSPNPNIIFQPIEGSINHQFVNQQNQQIFFSPPAHIRANSPQLYEQQRTSMNHQNSFPHPIQKNNISQPIKPQSVKRMQNVVRSSQTPKNQRSMIEYLNIDGQKSRVNLKSASPRSNKPKIPHSNSHSPSPPPLNNHHQIKISNSKYFAGGKEIANMEIVQRNKSSENKMIQRRIVGGPTQSQQLPKSHHILQKSQAKIVEKVERRPHQIHNAEDPYKQSVIKQVNSQMINQRHNQEQMMLNHSNNSTISPSNSNVKSGEKRELKVYSSYEQYLKQKNSGMKREQYLSKQINQHEASNHRPQPIQTIQRHQIVEQIHRGKVQEELSSNFVKQTQDNHGSQISHQRQTNSYFSQNSHNNPNSYSRSPAAYSNKSDHISSEGQKTNNNYITSSNIEKIEKDEQHNNEIWKSEPQHHETPNLKTMKYSNTNEHSQGHHIHHYHSKADHHKSSQLRQQLHKSTEQSNLRAYHRNEFTSETKIHNQYSQPIRSQQVNPISHHHISSSENIVGLNEEEDYLSVNDEAEYYHQLRQKIIEIYDKQINNGLQRIQKVYERTAIRLCDI